MSAERVHGFDVETRPCEHLEGRTVRWVSCKAGGSPERCGDAYLALSVGLNALRDAFKVAGLELNQGPARCTVVMPHDLYCGLRDALVAESEAGGSLFKRPRRKRIDPTRLVTMLGGIQIASEQAAPEDLRAYRCPTRSGR